ncbi:hypothetical protein [Colwellia piezophila]|uniref:hypothetical protein n=1 Tax=Colwellia piezophila TaxID=211668 RepID=UPI0003657541|nr:hypothetical protein [Colwellia piezophila]
MKNLHKSLAVLLVLQAGFALAVENTEDYYNCENKVTGTNWDYGTVPSWCDAASFGDSAKIKADFADITFDANEDEASERDRYMSAMYPVIRDAAEHYFDTRQPDASITEKAAWVHAVMATASIETRWSQYRDALDGKIKMIRGDLGHGHGMMQIDDRWHFTAIEEGKGVEIFDNISYALDIFHNGWKYSAAQSCVTDVSDWEARARSAYSAYNGGPSDWCRWQDSPITQDTNYIAHYSGKQWEDFVDDKNAVATIDATCYMDEGASCSVSEAPAPLSKINIGQFTSGSVFALLDEIDGTRLEYVRGPENAWEQATRFLELERDGDWVKVELMKYNDATETPLVGWMLDAGTVTWTEFPALGTLASDFPATILELRDEIDGAALGQYVRSATNAWNPADRVVLLERSGDWVKIEILRYLDVDETANVGWVLDSGNFDWISTEQVLDQQVGQFASGSVFSLLDEIDGTRLEYIRGPDNAWEQAARMLLLERDGDWVNVELMKYNDATEQPLIGWVFDAGAIEWIDAKAVGALKQDFAATILELKDAIDGSGMAQYIRSYSNAWNPADRVMLLERDSGWIKVEILRYLDVDETPNIGWVLEADNFEWFGGIAKEEGPTLSEIWENLYLTLPTGETCIHEAGTFHCVAQWTDAVCLNAMLNRETDIMPVAVEAENVEGRTIMLHDRHECLALVPSAFKVGDVIQTIGSLTLYDTVEAVIAATHADFVTASRVIQTQADGVYQILDVVVQDQFIFESYYKIFVEDKIGYIYGGSLEEYTLVEVDHEMLAQDNILVPQAGDTIVINQVDGVVLRDDTHVSGKAQAVIPQGKEVMVEETIIIGESGRVYYKVDYQNVLGFIYGGLISPEITLSEWASFTVPTPVEAPVVTVPNAGNDEVEVRPLAEGGSIWALILFGLLLPFRSRVQRRYKNLK